MPETSDMAKINKIKPESILSIKNLGVEVEKIPLLDSIDLELNSGEVVALVGPNGAGKSTLVKAIAGTQKYASGHIHFHGRAIDFWHEQGESEMLARHMAVLPQQSMLNFPFTAHEVVELGRTPHDSGSEEDAKIVNEVLKYLDAEHLADRLYTNLSGGEQQRIQLARVLAQIWRPASQARLLLLDEPSSYFDLAHQQLLVGIVRELASRGVAVIVVLHDLNLAMSCADKIAVLCCGRLEAVGKSEDVLNESCLKHVFSVNARFIQDAETGRRHMVLVD